MEDIEACVISFTVQEREHFSQPLMVANAEIMRSSSNIQRAPGLLQLYMH